MAAAPFKRPFSHSSYFSGFNNRRRVCVFIRLVALTGILTYVFYIFCLKSSTASLDSRNENAIKFLENDRESTSRRYRDYFIKDLSQAELDFQPSSAELSNQALFKSYFPYNRFLQRIHSFDLPGQEEIFVGPENLNVENVNKNINVSEFSPVPLAPSPQKYYQEVNNHTHFDARFCRNSSISSADINSHLVQLLRAWSSFTQQYNVMEWWIAHGNLLSWFWNQRIFPSLGIPILTFKRHCLD